MRFRNEKVVIISEIRTPIGDFGVSLKDISAVVLGSIVIRDALKGACLKPISSENTAMLPGGP